MGARARRRVESKKQQLARTPQPTFPLSLLWCASVFACMCVCVYVYTARGTRHLLGACQGDSVSGIRKMIAFVGYA
jgi:hypothetical protein